jgi:transposase
MGSNVKEFKPTSIDYDTRIFAFREKDESVGLTLLRSRQNIQLCLGDRQRSMLKRSKPTSATLCKKGSEYYIHIQIKSEVPEQIHVDTVLGVDLGITDIVVTSEGKKFGGKTIKLIKDHYASMRAVLQQKAVKGTRSSRRRCRELQQRLSGKESRYQRQINHEISKAIVTRAQEIPAKIALEDLAGIREGVNQKAGKNQRRCHVCGERGIRNGKSFKCPSCSWSGDADFNGAKNIAFLGRYVVRPGGSEGLPSIKAVLSELLKAHLL